MDTDPFADVPNEPIAEAAEEGGLTGFNLDDPATEPEQTELPADPPPEEVMQDPEEVEEEAEVLETPAEEPDADDPVPPSEPATAVEETEPEPKITPVTPEEIAEAEARAAAAEAEAAAAEQAADEPEPEPEPEPPAEPEADVHDEQPLPEPVPPAPEPEPEPTPEPPPPPEPEAAPPAEEPVATQPEIVQNRTDEDEFIVPQPIEATSPRNRNYIIFEARTVTFESGARKGWFRVGQAIGRTGDIALNRAYKALAKARGKRDRVELLPVAERMFTPKPVGAKNNPEDDFRVEVG